MITLGFLLGSSTLIVPAGPARQDAWISVLIGGAAGIAAVLLWLSLGNRYPGKLPAEYFVLACGKVAGGILSLLYIWFCLHLGALVVRNVVETYLTAIFVRTPGIVLAGAMTSLSVIAVLLGVEPFARSTEIMTPSVTFLIVILTFLTFITPNLPRIKNLLPILERGIVPVLKGALANFAFPFGETIVLMSFLPYVKRQREVYPYVLWPVVTATLLLAIVQVRNIAVLGAEGYLQAMFPSLLTIEMIDLGRFIQRLETLALFAWTFSTFMKITACFFAVVLNSKVLFGTSSERSLAVPAGAAMGVMSIWVYRTTSDMVNFADFIWPVYSFPFEVLMPLLVLVISILRSKDGSAR